MIKCLRNSEIQETEMKITDDMELLINFFGSGTKSHAGPIFPQELVLPRGYSASTHGHVTIFVVDGGKCVVNFGYDAEEALATRDVVYERWELPARIGEAVPDPRIGQSWFRPFVRYEHWTGGYELIATRRRDWSEHTWEMVLFPFEGREWDESFVNRGAELLKMLSPLRKLTIQQPAVPVRNRVFTESG